jgi:hypothetical protein
MTNYEAFFPYVLTEVPGAPEPVVLLAIRSACIEFCEKSLVLTRDHDPITMIPKICDYDLEPPTGYLVVKVQKAWVENNPIDPMAPDVVREASVYNRLFSSYNTGSGSTPQAYLQKEERSISVWPLPDRRYPSGLTLRVALKPTRASTAIDDVIFEDYAEVIASGALHRLMSSAGKAYTSPELSAVHKGKFDQGVNVARSRALHGNTRSNLSVKLRKI